MIYHKSKQVDFIEHGEANIDKIMHNGECVFTQGFDGDASGTDSVTLNGTIGKDLMDWSIVGNTVQDGVPSPNNPVEVKGVGDKTHNLFDGVTVNGEAVDVITGAFAKNPNRVRSGYIKVNPNTTYSLSSITFNLRSIVAYDSNKNYITYIYDDSRYNNYTFTTNSTTVYIAFGIIVEPQDYTKDKFIMLNEGSTPLPYEQYGYRVPVMSIGKNLVSEIVKNETISATEGAFIPYAQSLRTDFIKVKENVSYTISARYYSFQNYVVFYDKNKNYISRTGGTNVTAPRTFAIPQGCVYIATNAFKAIDSQINPLVYDDFDFQVEEGLTATSYEPYYTPKTFNQYVSSPLMANEILRSNGTITRVNGTIEIIETTPISTIRNEEKTILGATTIITTDTEVLPTQIEASYKSNKVDYVVVNFATADGNVFTTANGDTYTIKIRKSQYDTMMTNELLNLLEVM